MANSITYLRNHSNSILELDSGDQPITPTLILAMKNGMKLGVIQNVQRFTYRHAMNDVDEISFMVTKIVNGESNDLWYYVTDFKLVYIPKYDAWFEIRIKIDEDNETTKSVTGRHLHESELSQRLLFETEINTEDDIARDDYEVTVFYDPDKPEGSLLNRILADKAQDYSIFHVDDSLRNLQRTFTFNNKSIHDALIEIGKEFECLFIYGEHLESDGKLHRTISAYDLLDSCQQCGNRGNFTSGKCDKCDSDRITRGYGEDAGIFISHENIAKSVTLDTNADEVKNCFRLEAGDDVMTAVIRSVNPNGTQYIWHFSDDMIADMSQELQDALSNYDSEYEYFRTEYEMDSIPSSLISHHNALVDKYVDYNDKLEKITTPIIGTINLVDADYKARYMYDFLKTTMMPGSSEVVDTTAEEQIQELTPGHLSPLSIGTDRRLDSMSLATADSAVVSYSKVYVDTSRYRVTVSNSSYDTATSTWRGVITVSSYTDDDDVASTNMMALQFNTVNATYIKQQIDRLISDNKEKKVGFVSLFNLQPSEFAEAIKKYSLDSLQVIRDICTSCLNVMIEQGIADAGNDLYNQLYLPYYVKSGVIEDELVDREGELNKLLAPNLDSDLGLIDCCEKQRKAITAALDIRTFLGDELWQELMAYRRDDSYSNSNYISDGLTDAELIENAQKFYDAAMKEIIKASTLQHSLSGSLQDFLLMPEFAGIVDNFEVGNWIFVEVDEHAYKLRMTEYQLNFDSIENISIDFSDVMYIGDVVSDTRAILDQAKSIATSYETTVRQAEKGKHADDYWRDIASRGLDLTTNKIVNSADNQSMIYDHNGLLMRRKDDFSDDYVLEQVKIINQGLYYTKDGWRTSSAGIGHFKYVDPRTGQEVDGYGVIANTIVGDLILGNDLSIYNENGAVIMNGEGTVFTIRNDEDNTGLFKIRKQNPNGTYSDIIYIDADGNLRIQGASIQIGGGTIEEYIDETVAENAGTLMIMMSNEYIGVNTNYDGTGGDFSNVFVDITVMKGSTDITDEVTYLATPSQSITGVWDSVNHRYTVSNLSADEGTVTFTIYYRDITATRIFKVAKVKNGSGENALNVVIDSSAGIIFKNNNISSILTCYVFSGTTDITSSVSSFDWYRVLPDGTRDQSWSRIGAGNIITISSADVSSKAVFRCDVTI